jgi:hypothetical protein
MKQTDGKAYQMTKSTTSLGDLKLIVVFWHESMYQCPNHWCNHYMALQGAVPSIAQCSCTKLTHNTKSEKIPQIGSGLPIAIWQLVNKTNQNPSGIWCAHVAH